MKKFQTIMAILFFVLFTAVFTTGSSFAGGSTWTDGGVYLNGGTGSNYAYSGGGVCIEGDAEYAAGGLPVAWGDADGNALFGSVTESDGSTYGFNANGGIVATDADAFSLFTHTEAAGVVQQGGGVNLYNGNEFVQTGQNNIAAYEAESNGLFYEEAGGVAVADGASYGIIEKDCDSAYVAGGSINGAVADAYGKETGTFVAAENQTSMGTTTFGYNGVASAGNNSYAGGNGETAVITQTDGEAYTHVTGNSIEAYSSSSASVIAE